MVDKALKLQGIVHHGGTRHHLRSEKTHKNVSIPTWTMDDEPGRRHRGAALHGDVVPVRHPSSIVSAVRKDIRCWEIVKSATVKDVFYFLTTLQLS